jgi:hypothetical protein
MSWFAAHIIMGVKLKEGPQARIPVWENIVLIKAPSEEVALAKAQQRGRAEEGDDDGTFHWGGRPARWVFAGIRKLTLCQDDHRRPDDGTEVSFVEMEVASEDGLAKLVAGEPESVKLRDRFASVAAAGDQVAS